MKKIFSAFSVLLVALLAVSCSNELEAPEAEMGYLKLGIETNSTTITRASAPTNYDARQLHVDVKNAAGDIIASTDDYANDSEFNSGYLTVTPGQYTVVAHSNNWDGNGSGFNTPYYYGETTVTVKTKTVTTAKVTCTQANVKVSVNYSDEFKASFSRATTTVETAIEGISAQTFTMGADKGSAYFPVGNLTLTLSVFNMTGEGHSLIREITNVQARDHYIVNFTVASHGYQGGVNVQVDPNTNTYTYTFQVPRKGGTSLAAYTANAWSSFAYLEGAVTAKKSDFDQSKLQLQWKTESATTWNSIAANELTINGDNISHKLTNLTPETNYVYRFAYVTDKDEVFSAEGSFTTEAQPALYNGGFENWYSVSNYSSPNESGVEYWDTSNPGSASFNYVVTFPETSFVHGGSTSAKLQAAYAVIKLAAGSIFTGKFGKVSGTSASLDWGVPFTGRPTALHGFKSYTPGTINRGTQPDGVGAPASGSNDVGIIRVALLTEKLAVNNKDMSTFPDWQTDPRVIGYGELNMNTSDNGEWVEFTLPIEYHSMTAKPSYLLVMGATCKFGDYFYGSDSSLMYLDDFELIYGDTPVTQ